MESSITKARGAVSLARLHRVPFIQNVIRHTDKVDANVLFGAAEESSQLGKSLGSFGAVLGCNMNQQSVIACGTRLGVRLAFQMVLEHHINFMK